MMMTMTLLDSMTGEVGDIVMVTTGGLRMTRRVDTSDTPTPAPPSRVTVYCPASEGLSFLTVREMKSAVRSTVNLWCEVSRLIDAALCDNICNG